MNIGAAAASGVTPKMIRHYEAIGLVRPAQRRSNDYRDYGEREVHELRFVKRARRLGFSIDEIGALLALWRDRGRPSRDVRRIAEAHVRDLEARIAEMQTMAKTLGDLMRRCHGDDRPDCPILDELALGGDDGRGCSENRQFHHSAQVDSASQPNRESELPVPSKQFPVPWKITR